MLTNFERVLDEWIEQKKAEGLEMGDGKKNAEEMKQSQHS